MNMLASLAGRTALITGGASGIGAACSRLFVRQGAKVLVADNDEEGGQRLAEELGESASFVLCDVTQEADVAAAVSEAVMRWGQFSIMCNNAGIGGRQGREGLIENVECEDFDRVLQINLRGALLGTKYAARAMKAKETRGCIINTASIAGLRPNLTSFGAPIYLPAGYIASKRALIGLTELAACELAPAGIRVNAVAPGVTATHTVGRFLTHKPNPTDEEVRAALADNSVLEGLCILPEDVASAMLFLASDMGRCINGVTLPVDLGVTAGVTGELTVVSGTIT